jgi:hypothetical protein
MAKTRPRRTITTNPAAEKRRRLQALRTKLGAERAA